MLFAGPSRYHAVLLESHVEIQTALLHVSGVPMSWMRTLHRTTVYRQTTKAIATGCLIRDDAQLPATQTWECIVSGLRSDYLVSGREQGAQARSEMETSASPSVSMEWKGENLVLPSASMAITPFWALASRARPSVEQHMMFQTRSTDCRHRASASWM